MTIREIERRLRKREISCVELVQETFRAIRERERWNSFVTLTEESALSEAAELDRELAAGQDRGVLHGIPVAYKDLFCTRGVRTTAGSLVYRDFVPNQDAEVVRKQRARGVVCIGKTNLHELAFGITSQNPHYGPVMNPVDDTRIPGGSSGGSAALVAAQLVPVAWGTDTGGSIRIPASYCGVVGFKPTYGRINTKGVLPLSWSLDHAGPLCQTAGDCAVAAGIELTPRFDLKGVRIGIPKNYFFEHVEQSVSDAVHSCVRRMEEQGGLVGDVALPDMREVNATQRLIQWGEAGAHYEKYRDPALFGPDVWALLQQGMSVRAHEYVNSQRLRTTYRRQMDALWRTVDVIVTPTTPITAPKRGATSIPINGVEEDVRIASTRLVRGFNLFGEPAISIPWGTDEQKMPIGVQLIAKPHADQELLEIASLLEN